MLLAAARRFLTLLAGIAAVTAVVSLPFGLLLGARLNRSLAVGFYLVGCALLLGGFFTGNRGPFRVANEEAMVGLRRPRGVRVVSGEEQAETFNAIQEALQDGWYRPNVAYWSDVDEAINTAVQAVIVDGAPVQSTLDDLHDQIEQAAQAAGAEYPPSS